MSLLDPGHRDAVLQRDLAARRLRPIHVLAHTITAFLSENSRASTDVSAAHLAASLLLMCERGAHLLQEAKAAVCDLAWTEHCRSWQRP